ncbi:hypothetical protein B0T10DRAFT_571906 [Thelonectria olida]|uniref:Azaphilone pigments biosynthesis cluster protein L N-terminal domain-containing protein n=1 Tax=Thelonectria olida TaxID=1576542 RepID=A0A9P9APK0_9HYPO|nr:hypothetical protein B0T10DRAFT_571906 [Thelonectria olida]
MAEVLGAVSGAVSLVAFTGQLAKSAASLYTFVNDIKDAPDDVRRIAQELQISQLVLSKLPSTFTGQDVDLNQALAHCEGCVDELIEFKKKIDPEARLSRHGKLWAQCKFAAKRSDLAKYLSNLQRANFLLQQACSVQIRWD